MQSFFSVFWIFLLVLIPLFVVLLSLKGQVETWNIKRVKVGQIEKNLDISRVSKSTFFKKSKGLKGDAFVEALQKHLFLSNEDIPGGSKIPRGRVYMTRLFSAGILDPPPPLRRR